MTSARVVLADSAVLRYAQCWEDADILLEALDIQPGDRCLSIASAGDNTLAMLTRRPERIVAIDMNPAQLAALELRIAAYRHCTHQELLELVGSRPATGRARLYHRCRGDLGQAARMFWDARMAAVERWGIGGVGRFERYFRLFRQWILPLAHRSGTVESLLEPRDPQARRRFHDRTWNTLPWRMIFGIFFSRPVMGRLGRDPALFRYVQGSVAQRILDRTTHALTALDPSENPYLQWILTGHHRTALPAALRPEAFETIRQGLDRIDPYQLDLASALDAGIVDGCSRFNLSDIFEYMPEAEHHQLLERMLDIAPTGARWVYWNMLAPRMRPQRLAERLLSLDEPATRLLSRDRAFFYSALRIEEVAG
ncbi:MAG: DUF3419 family protein [Phycisphaeraceae bacterium]|nr:DUF3419 family protein [Phycisphaeraceae bacterium]